MIKIRKYFTLVELIIAMVVLGVLATFAVPSYWGTHQRTRIRESQAMLKLIQSAEKVRELETGAYVACSGNLSGINGCNTLLNLDIPDNGITYSVVTGAGICGQATLPLGLPSQRICTNDDHAVNGTCGGAC
ncbi:MAG: prepilin-type N-terminal cleavage/methylation domain-containing protein [Candidatus Omnitrophica bacterium]|nr:prepilin-type N-terminal cleavage/methylation domain-containing protein [Candidatus Omnitrophota bacterium]